ncbi:MAG: FKBP-type 16 kDa peptidyl-prolyl cis-trans isomerase [Chlamydiia bacterium]|nr:FKBP-type 16 kDa peptidyl-prolyl cis-trans isomerase [Chlamydiia bacterium]MCH9618169.1 FKBP-type 16 kDa peptidyl-prolyl cis-trans isomerase [Chlamydiia bacterium]MCH9624479.1 FKBP-type 16 kDa peptidyl-prolyl cis-trans isomerase [Chlamydiia bacterium]
MSKKATSGDTVHIHYKGTLDDGSVFDTSYDRGEPLKFKLGKKEVIEGFENACLNMAVGEKKEVKIPPKQAYGEYSKELIQEVERKYFPEDIELTVGQEFMIGGNEFETMAKVIKIDGDKITLDANPELAGKTLNFAIELVDIV